MSVSIKQLAMESTEIGSNDDELIALGDDATEQLVALETSATMGQYVSTESLQVSIEERGFLRRLGGDMADGFKIMFAWADGNGAKIRKTRQAVREARQKLRGITITGDVHGNGLLTQLGNHAHHVGTVPNLIKLVDGDVTETKKVLVTMVQDAGLFTRELVEYIYSKDNDWKWGYDEAVDGCIPIINKYISKLMQPGKSYKIEGYDHNDLRVEDGSKFSELFLGNYAISTSWAEAHETAKHLEASSEALQTYADQGAHDFVKVPKIGNKYSLTGAVTVKDLEALLDAADAYLDAADACAKSIKANAFPVWKTLAMSNVFTGAYGAVIKSTSSKNYRALYRAMLASRNWSMKLQRKAATRNQDMAKHLVEFVKVNSK